MLAFFQVVWHNNIGFSLRHLILSKPDRVDKDLSKELFSKTAFKTAIVL